MPVVDVQKDLDQHTLTITAEFAAPPERVWALYADPRQIEQVWGPPTFPATFVQHELSVGSVTKYYMTSPEGERYGGWWEVTAVDEPHTFSFRDGFADGDLEPVDSMPVSECVYRLEATEAGTRATYVTTYADADALQQVLSMGMEEGATSAIDQIDAFLAA